ncbi:hypothetical protein [Streptomyces sp. NPDC001658]
MSAADPAHPTTGGSRGRLATVHTFPASRPPRRIQRRESTTVPATPAPDLTPHEQFAATLEDLFAKHGRSLTDEGTVQDFLITLSAIRDLLAGARSSGMLEPEAHRELDATIEGMMAVPKMLA